jgi:hypothetical protein
LASTFPRDADGQRIAAGEDQRDLCEELTHEANLVFGHFNLEYEIGLFTKGEMKD